MRLVSIAISLWLISQMFFWGSDSPSLGIGLMEGTRPDRVLFVAAVFFFAIAAIGRQIKLERFEKIDFFMLAFSFWCSISLFLSEANVDTSYSENKWLNAMFNITFFPFVSYYIGKHIGSEYKNAKIIMFTFCIIGIYLGMIGIFEHFDLNWLVWPSDIFNPSKGTHFGRTRGPFLDAVAMGRVLTICFLVLLWMACKQNIVTRIALLLASGTVLMSLYFTYTRGPWIGFAIANSILLIMRTRLRKHVILFFLVTLAASIIGVTGKLSITEETLFSKRQNTFNDREISYKVTTKIIADHLLTGIGFGRLDIVWPAYYHEKDFPGIIFGGYDGSHSTYLTVFAETGIIGIFTYISYHILIFSKLLYNYFQLDRRLNSEKELITITIGILLAYVSSGAVSDLRWFLFPNVSTFTIIGICFGYSQQGKNEK